MDDDFALDSYETEGGFLSMYKQDDEYRKEEIIYQELLGRYQGCSDATGNIYDKTQWDRFNNSLDRLVALGHQDYSTYKMSPRMNGAQQEYVFATSFKSELMTVIRRVSEEFGFSDPNHLLYHESPKNGHSFYNSANNNLHNSQSQQQEQHQSVSIEQAVDEAIENVRKTVGEKAAAEAKEHLEPLKKNSSWENVQEVFKWLANASKDVAIAAIPVLGPVVLQRMRI